MGKCYPIIHFLDFGGILHLYSQPNRLMERVIKKVSHGSHQSPQSHFAVPTMEGMALGPSPVRTLASLAAHHADPQKYTGPSTAEGKAARFFHGTKPPISLETKGGVRQIGQQSYRFATVARTRTGRERFLWEGEALYGCLGAEWRRLVRAGGARSGKPIPTAAAARRQAEARWAYDQSRNVVLFQGDRARDSTFDQGFRG